MITPKIVNVQGVKTPPNVPNFSAARVGLAAGLDLPLEGLPNVGVGISFLSGLTNALIATVFVWS
jgi:hypothetical protein